MGRTRAVDPLGVLRAAETRHEAAVVRMLDAAFAARREGTEAALAADARALAAAERAGERESNAWWAWQVEQRRAARAAEEEDQ